MNFSPLASLVFRRASFTSLASGTLVALAVLATAGSARSDSADAGSIAAVYGNLPPDQAEFLSSPEHIKSVALSSGSPMEIWETLEHGESVECLDCIAAVAPLLYAGDSHTREIAAWWLRRRTFGVFGAGEVYQTTVSTLASDPSAMRRANAASALGEFLDAKGITPVATALAGDADEGVRTSAALALGRLNDDGAGALGKAMGDASVPVKLAALTSASKINAFTDNASISTLLGDGDARVRKRAANVLDKLGTSRRSACSQERARSLRSWTSPWSSSSRARTTPAATRSTSPARALITSASWTAKAS